MSEIKTIEQVADLYVNQIQRAQMTANAQTRAPWVSEYLASSNVKQSKCWSDYGYPNELTFDHFYTMYKRSGYAKAGVEVVADKCWQSNPWIETSSENWNNAFKDWARRVNLWHNLKLLDYRQRVGEYGALLLTVADDKMLSEPLDGGYSLEAIESVTPYYQSQIVPIDYYEDTKNSKYGLPKTYELREQALGDRNEGTNNPRIVHESRVLIWAEGTTGNSIFGNSVLEAGFNALINIEKIQGAGGEGFWKNARTPLQITADSGKDIQQLAQTYGCDPSELSTKINEKLKDYNKNLDSAFLLGGMTATPLTVSMPQPEQFLVGDKLEFAASVKVPLTILEGNQTGNQSSIENGSTFDEQCESRRANEIDNFIMRKLINKLVDMKTLTAPVDLCVCWESLLEPSPTQKLDAVMKMVEANAKALGTGIQYFTADEVRERAGYEPMDIEVDSRETDVDVGE